MTNKSSILLATTHWKNNSHHSNYSGFQRIAQYLIPYFNVTLVTWGNQAKHYEENNIDIVLLKSKGKTFFKKRNLISNYCKENGHCFDFVYLLYSDIGLRLGKNINYISAVHNLVEIGKYKSIKEQIILWIKHNLIEPRVYQYSSKIISVASNIQSILAQRYPSKVHYIPHGIDVHFWKPTNEQYVGTNFNGFSKMAICVGINGVNLAEVKKCIDALPSVLFCLVGAFQFDNPNVRILKGISDEELRGFYQQADVFFRPLDFATANNSLLEAMAMEKKIVITKTGGVVDYIDENYAYLAKEDNSNFIEKLKECLNDKAIPRNMNNLRNYTCQNFAWEVIAEKTYQLLV